VKFRMSIIDYPFSAFPTLLSNSVSSSGGSILAMSS
jgi:hypothetical protein